MATEKEIFISINGTQQAIKSLDDLQKATADLAKGFEDAGEAAEDAGTEINKIGGGNKLSKGLGKIGSIGKSAFKGIGTAIKASGIGLLVTVVAKLVEQFTKTDAGAKILQGSMAVLGVIFEKIETAVSWIIDNLVSAFTNPQQAVEDLRAGVQRLGDWFKSLGDYIKQNFILILQKMQSRILEARIAWNEFTGDQEEADLLKAQLESINEEIDNTRMIIDEAAQEVAEPFVAAANLISDVVSDIVKESGAAIQASNAAIDAANRFAALQNQLIVQNAELSKDLESQKKISEDTTRTYEERKEALDAVIAANEQLAQNALIEAKALENKVKLQLSIASNDEDRRALEAELAAATAERIAREQEAEIVRLESAQLNRELDQEELERAKGINDTLAQLRLENVEDEEQAALEGLRLAEEATIRELELQRATQEQILEAQRLFEEQRTQVTKEFSAKRDDAAKESADKQTAIEKERADAIKAAEEDLQAAKLDAFRGGIAAIAQLAGENERLQNALFVVDQAVAAGQVILGAVKEKAANAAYAATLGPAGPAYLIPANVATNVRAGVALATIAATTISKLSAKKPTAADTGGNGGGGGAPVFDPTAAIEQQNAELTGTQDPGAAITPGGGNQQPIRAYVVATEVTSAQEANAQIDNLATL